jgi:hypothetical protein
MSSRFTIGEALNSLGVKEWVLSNEPTNEAEFFQCFSKVVGVDENQNAVLSNSPADFGVTWNEIQAEITHLQAEHAATEYQRQRAAEYPPMADYIDGVVKGDQAQIDAYVAACLAVKAKYPKPQE